MYAPDDFCVISAVDDEAILAACLARSPDIAAGALPLVTITGAVSMADAYNRGLDRKAAPICLLAHQDVYLPRGWLDRAMDVLDALTRSQPDWRVAGPYGVEAGGRHVGRIWDATLGRELGSAGFAPTPVESFDELLLLLRRDDAFRFDPELPHFHLYGTDIAQTAWTTGRSAWVVELPVVHNNRPVISLRGGYARAYRFARRKWRARLPIHTTICALTDSPFALWRAQWRCRRRRGTRGGLAQRCIRGCAPGRLRMSRSTTTWPAGACAAGERAAPAPAP